MTSLRMLAKRLIEKPAQGKFLPDTTTVSTVGLNIADKDIAGTIRNGEFHRQE